MGKIGVRYVGAVLDTSGYANAARHYVDALNDSSEIDLTVGLASFEQQKTTHGQLFERIKSLINKIIPYNINIVHLTPENFIEGRVKGKYNIGYTVWETDKLPLEWVNLCNLMNEIWVPSEWNVEIFKRCGVTKPIHKIPHAISIPDLTDMQNITMAPSADTFVFYSIFQWLERKNPTTLLKAYLTEFSKDENVCLAMKSYRINTGPKEQEVIKNSIANTKAALNLKEYPPILFFGSLLTDEKMKGFHNRGDCFVLPHRGEGFGIPHAEAMSYGNPVISTRYSGNLEFMNDENSYLIDYQETPVYGMIFPNYHGHMSWAEPSVMHLRKLMRFVFENRKEAKAIGQRAKKYIANNYNNKAIGDLMVNRLKEIIKQHG